MPHPAQVSTDTLTELLSHLVRFPTITSDQATNRAALDWIEEQLHGLPLHIERLERQGFPSLIATTQRTRAPRLWLQAHIDVVPAIASAFTPRIHNGRLHGRGAYDTKFAIATFITLLQELGANLPHYDLGLMLTSDEEVGGSHGVKWLTEDLGYRGQAVLVPDSGSSWEMEMGSKGVMWWELTATGRAAHASRTWEGVNAIDKLVRFVEHVQTNLPSEPCGDPRHQHPTINFGTITAGHTPNQVPDTATARLDIRFPPELTLDAVTGWINAAQLAVSGVTATTQLADPPYRVKPAAAITLFQKLIREVTGHNATPTTAHGSSDARHFARLGIPTINVCPTGGNSHMPDEWIDLADLGRFYEVTRRFVDAWAKP